MTAHASAIILLVVSMALLWLLMAAPLGLRTLRIQRTFQADRDRLWGAVSPLGPHSDWHHAVLSSRVLPGAPGRVEQSFTHLDRNGQPIVRAFEVRENRATATAVREIETRVVEDSALDASFWKDYFEKRRIDGQGDAVTLTVEQTDRYRGVAFLAFRFFALRREMKSLGEWLTTGESRPVTGGFEHPLVQCALALLSTLILWPFFGLGTYGLVISSLLTLVIVLHEFGHMAAYRAFGHRRVRMIFVPLLGGIAIGGRPYKSLFEVAVCALMGAGMSAFLVPVVIALHRASEEGLIGLHTASYLLVFLLIMGAFNLLNLLPMNRFDGGQVLRQVFRDRASLTAGSFLVTLVILVVGWRIGLPTPALLGGLAVFTLLSIMGGKEGVKPRHSLDAITEPQRLAAGAGLYAALALHAYAIVYATDRLFDISV